MLSLQSGVRLFETLWTVAHQARILEWVAISTSRGSSGPRGGICVPSVSCIGSRFFRGKVFGKSRLSGWEEEEAGRGQAPVSRCLSRGPRLEGFQLGAMLCSGCLGRVDN